VGSLPARRAKMLPRRSISTVQPPSSPSRQRGRASVCHRPPEVGLTVADQKLLATWIAKTTMTAEFIQPKQVAISQATRDRFYATPEPPAHWTIWIAFCSGTEWLAGNIFHHGVGMYMPPLEMKLGVKNTQYTVITLGHLMCICAGSEDERQEFKLDARMQPALRQLWPAQGQDISWPPDRSFDDQGAQAVTKAFGRWMGLDVPALRSAKPTR
jgi:hypothetical protein